MKVIACCSALIPVVACAAPAVPATAPVVSTRAFQLYSHPWINLHHFVYQWARGNALREPDDRRRPVEVVEASEASALTESQASAWNLALDGYGRLVGQDLLFNKELWLLKGELAELGDPGSPGLKLPEGVARELTAAAPLYWERWWPSHDSANRRWIEAVAPRARQFEERLIGELARAYGGTWPSQPIHVDLTAYANYAGAYTSNRPAHVTISSTDPDNAPVHYGFESLFHEASHTSTITGTLRADLERVFGELDARPPRDLWHVILFFTTSNRVGKILAEEGIEGFEPYAERTGMYARLPAWAAMRDVLAEHWQPFLNGELEREAALRRIATAIVSRDFATPR